MVKYSFSSIFPFQWYLDGPCVMRPPATILFSRRESRILSDSSLDGQLIKTWQNLSMIYNRCSRNINSEMIQIDLPIPGSHPSHFSLRPLRPLECRHVNNLYEKFGVFYINMINTFLQFSPPGVVLKLNKFCFCNLVL